MGEAEILPPEKQHRIDIRCDGGGRMCLVRGGPDRAYLWFEAEGGLIDTVSGEAQLRALAEAILAELAEPNRKGRKRTTA